MRIPDEDELTILGGIYIIMVLMAVLVVIAEAAG